MEGDHREEMRRLRQRLGISQAKICSDLEINLTQFNLWERGNGRLRPEVVDSIAAYLALELRSVQALTAPTRTGVSHV